MQLQKIEDPRDALDKARRKELERYAKENGVAEIRPGMPAIMMRRILRSKNLTDIKTPVRQLGFTQQEGTLPPGFDEAPQPQSIVAESPSTTEKVSAEDDLARQWLQQQAVDQPVTQDELPSTMGGLRKLCKERGIKIKRTDRMDVLMAKLTGTWNGQDSP